MRCGRMARLGQIKGADAGAARTWMTEFPLRWHDDEAVSADAVKKLVFLRIQAWSQRFQDLPADPNLPSGITEPGNDAATQKGGNGRGRGRLCGPVGNARRNRRYKPKCTGTQHHQTETARRILPFTKSGNPPIGSVPEPPNTFCGFQCQTVSRQPTRQPSPARM